MSKPTIIYTKTDEAPALATYSFLPLIRAFASPFGVEVDCADISLAGRIIANFPEKLSKEQRQPDALTELGVLTQSPDTNIIKLPNISASIPQIKACVAELQSKGYDVPSYPEEPKTDEEFALQARFNVVKGSAVNPVLRMGNSDRRAPPAVKEFARKNPHSMGTWTRRTKTRVCSMESGDFRHNERSVTVPSATDVSIEFTPAGGESTTTLKRLSLRAGEVIDTTHMSRTALVSFLERQVALARDEGLLFSLHMKATMMKVSDPIIFGHAVRVYFSDLIEKHSDTLEKVGFNPNNGFGDLVSKMGALDSSKQDEINADLEALYAKGPAIAMVNSDKGITNLHAGNDVIIDASMPAMIRSSGCMWNADGKLQETLAVIPDSSYAGVYQAVVDFCKENGAFDPVTMGSVSNVGLMAEKAEEYGSHDKTFEMKQAGVVRVVDASGAVLASHEVEQGDIWRMCQTKDAPIRDWVGLAVRRARDSGAPAVFWLDETRPHDRELIAKVKVYLKDHDTSGLNIQILDYLKATDYSLARAKEGKDTISVTGNVLRDYNTDLFPILEVGTSAKMLSIVPLMAGGGLFETGAGGSAPKHVQQFEQEGHLRWDSLGEFLALAVSFQHFGKRHGNDNVTALGKALDEATTRYLLNNKSPSRKVGELDNRGSQFYLCLYWAQVLSETSTDESVKARFTRLAEALSNNEETIIGELNAAQGSAVDVGGYFLPDVELATKAMRPSSTFNAIIAEV